MANLQNYDINQMIRKLNTQLVDSVEYLVINSEEGKTYVGDGESRTSNGEADGLKLDFGRLSVEVDPDDFDEDDWRKQKKVTYETERVNKTTHHFNIDIGLNNWVEDEKFSDATNPPYPVKPLGSWYVGLNSINRTWLVGQLVFLEWGLGINWYNWKLEDSDFRIEKSDQRIDFNRTPAQSGLKSKLTASYINAQVVPMVDFSKGSKKITTIESERVRIKKHSRQGFRLGLGGYVGYRLGSHTKFIFRENGERQKDKEHDNFYLASIRYGLRVQVGWKSVELFGTYDLNEVFSSGRGPAGSPRLNAVSFGITL